VPELDYRASALQPTPDVRQTVLAVLLDHLGQFVSGTQLSQLAGVSRTAVWKHVQALAEWGCHIESVPRLGHKLVKAPDLLLPAVVKARIPKDQSIGQQVFWYPETDSTNVQAARLTAEGAPHGTVVTALTQTGGKGRRGRVWFSPRQGLWFSVVLRLPIPVRKASDLTLLTSVAVRRAIVRLTGLPVAIKWPNDLLLGQKKVCGILAEIRAEGEMLQHAVLGIGINTNIPRADFPAELAPYATSLLAESGQNVSNVDLALAIFSEMESLFNRLADDGVGFEAVVDEWRSASATLGQRVRIQVPQGTISGIAKDVDASGVLYVQTDNGATIPVQSGEVLF
jgi:BirA family biotin operon repressor/biotin-[acetyl-CoA-carboxylase] ligase